MRKKHFWFLFFITSLLTSCSSGNDYDVLSANEEINLLNEEYDVSPFEGKYFIGNNETIYNAVLGEFDYYLNKAYNIKDRDEKLVALANAEAKLIDSNVYMPFSHGDINYHLTKIVPHTYYQVNDINPYSFKNVLLIDSFVDKSLNEKIEKLYKDFYNDDEFYSQLINLLNSNNHKIKGDLKVFFDNEYISLNPYDKLTYANSMLLRQVFDSLFEYDIFGNIKCNIASEYSTDYENGELIVKIKDNAYWYKDGEVYDTIDAYDLYNSYEHLLKNNKFCDYIDNSNEYILGRVNFNNVGIKVIDSKTIKYKTNNIDGLLHFLTTLDSAPIHEDFIESNYNEKIFSGCYYINKYDKYEVLLSKINNHYNSIDSQIDKIKFSIEYITTKETINKVLDDTYSFVSFIDNQDLYEQFLNDDFLCSKLIEVQPNNNIYYFVFNLNRMDYLNADVYLKSDKTIDEHKYTWFTIQNKNFRKAIYHCINKLSFIDNFYNTNKIKNTFNSYNLFYLNKKISYSGKTYQKNMSYGEIIQSFLDYKISDDCNDSYNNELAKSCFKKFEIECNIEKVITLDVLYLANNKSIVESANFFKSNIEKNFEGKVIINLIEAKNLRNYLYALSDGAYDLLLNFGYRPESNSIYDTLNSFSINGTNIALTCL